MYHPPTESQAEEMNHWEPLAAVTCQACFQCIPDHPTQKHRTAKAGIEEILVHNRLASGNVVRLTGTNTHKSVLMVRWLLTALNI